MQGTFGRGYSQISRIYTTTLELVYEQHRSLVCDNLVCYSRVFDRYNGSINSKIALSEFKIPPHGIPGMVPGDLCDVFGFVDGVFQTNARPGNDYQNAMWNEYYHAHGLLYLGISFLDGMALVEIPNPGYYTDVMQWNETSFRHDLNIIMNQCAATFRRRLKLYGDRIFNSDNILTGAYCRRNGPLQPFMTVYNAIMSPIRVGAEWSFGKIAARNSMIDFTAFKRDSDCEDIYCLCRTITNCHTCLYGSQHTSYFEIAPPTLIRYMRQV